ncbi:hypothetical protein BGZ92_002018, partial [Podila epicladia]
MFRAIRPTSTLYRASALYKNAAVSSPARASMAMNFARMYSAGAGLARSDVEKRVLDILAGFNKVDAKKVNTTHHIVELEIARAPSESSKISLDGKLVIQGR